MTPLPERYDRNARLFGNEGQRKIRQTKVAVVGVGGLGSPLVQHLALLGIGEAALIDDDELDETSRNRWGGRPSRRHRDVPGWRCC